MGLGTSDKKEAKKLLSGLKVAMDQRIALKKGQKNIAKKIAQAQQKLKAKKTKKMTKKAPANTTKAPAVAEIQQNGDAEAEIQQDDDAEVRGGTKQEESKAE